MQNGSDKDLSKVEQAAKVLRNCRKIEHRIHQLQKQLYLGNTTAYNLLMEHIYPNYKEHKKAMQDKLHSKPFENSTVLDNVVASLQKGVKK